MKPSEKRTSKSRVRNPIVTVSRLTGARLSWLGLCLMVVVSVAPGQISPGELAKAHEKLEGIANCTKCHVLGEEVTNEKCLSCHTAIRTRTADGRGYHGSTELKGKKCASCHSDHQGREFEMVHWEGGQKLFNHDKTGWALAGAHRKLDCRTCHKADFIRDVALSSETGTKLSHTLLGLTRECLGCHVDEHREQMTDKCENCHNAELWTPAPHFDHAKSRYALTGKHDKVACDKCHALMPAPPPETSGLVEKKNRVGQYVKYGDLQFANCTPCHTDPHENRFGQDCQSCHLTASFTELTATAKFDHSRTKYALQGKHVAVACAKCHKSGSMTEPLAFANCSDCHRDTHRGQLANREDKGRCESCHDVQGFKPAKYAVKEHEKSRYPLTGSHLAVPCFACHTQITEEKSGATFAKFDFEDRACKGCHKDAHNGESEKWVKEGGCESCHVTDSWHKVNFDHAKTRFALVGKHASAACLKCHKKDELDGRAFVHLINITMVCLDCHKDVHQGQFVRAELGESVTQCQRCHAPEGWKKTTFDHTRDAKFALDGAHLKVTCAACHIPETQADGSFFTKYKPLGRECSDCHAAEMLKIEDPTTPVPVR